MEKQQQKLNPEGWNTIQPNFNIEQIKEAYLKGLILQGKVLECDENCNLKINLGSNIIGIVPQNEFDIEYEDENSIIRNKICQNKVGSFVQFKVKKICNDKQVLLSRKEVIQDALQWVESDLQEGSILNGVVKNIRKYGVFVDIGGGMVGLLHIEDISISRIKSPEERFKIGQKIKVMIKSIDKDNHKVVLSHKELLGNFEENIQDYQEKMIVERHCKRS